MSSPRSEVDEEEVQLTNQLTEIREVRRKQGRRLTQTGEEGGGAWRGDMLEAGSRQCFKEEAAIGCVECSVRWVTVSSFASSKSGSHFISVVLA